MTAVLPARAATAARGVPARVVELAEGWTAAECAELAALAWRAEVAVVPVRVDGPTVLIGPAQHRGAPVCLACAEHARATVRAGRAARDDLPHHGTIPPAAAELVAELAAACAAGAGAPGADRVWAVRAADLAVSTHRARPRAAGCPRCAVRPADAAAAVASPSSCAPCDPRELRAANPRTGVARLRAELADWRFGPVTHSSRSERICLPIAQAELALRAVDGEGGYGRCDTYGDAERTALYEAVERITGLAPTARRTALFGSYADLAATLGADAVLDPITLGRHEPAAEGDPRFALAAYHPQLPLRWVWGWSARTGAPQAVPEQAAYWGVPQPAGQGVLAESSNGCGLGNSPAEAALFGWFEIVERDAFLMAWFARTPLARITVPPSDRLTGALADRLDMLGYELLLLSAGNDLDVPVVVAVALCRDRAGAAPQAFVAAGAHLDPARALRSAVVEVAVNVEQAPNVARADPGAYDRARLRPMLADPGAVRTIDDHVGLNALPEARGRLEPLLSGAGPRPLDELCPPTGPEPDAADLLARLRAHALDCGVDTVVVDQSEPGTRARLGLHAARVVAPGALSLTFGHLYRRTLGLPRLTRVPAALGRLAAEPSYDSLPLDPHPFP